MSDTVYIYDVPKKIDIDKEIWTDKTGKDFEKSYCSACEVLSIKCPVCELGSCSGGSCNYCHESFMEWLEANK